jgi:putative ABC transport system substrate-binding protein
MKRRDFIAGLGGIALAPGLLRGQERRPLIAMISPLSASGAVPNLQAFRQGMAKLGFQEGRNYTLTARFSEGDKAAAEAAAKELVALNPDLIVAGAATSVFAHAASSTIPIVMVGMGGDPEELGLAQSLAHPGGNVTGNLFNALTASGALGIDGKRLSLLAELVPRLSRLGALFNPDDEQDVAKLAVVPQAAADLRFNCKTYLARNTDELKVVLAAMAASDDQAFYISGSPFLLLHRVGIAERIDAMRRPAIGSIREQAVAGLLLAYSPSIPDSYRRAADQVVKILKGAKPGDLPIEQAVKFDLFVNLKAAARLGIEIPPMFLARVDEVIE